MNLYLIGYRASGKTTIGKLLASELKMPFIDTDLEIEKRAGCSVREYFDSRGEPDFRELESKVVDQSSQLENSVVSLGGGACERSTNRDRINETGKTVWLDCCIEELHRRIQQANTQSVSRPALTDLAPLDEIRSLLAVRRENYAACADFRVDTSNIPPAQAVQEIAEWFHQVDKI